MKCHFKVGDMVRVVGMTKPCNVILNGIEGIITEIIDAKEEALRVYPEIAGRPIKVIGDLKDDACCIIDTSPYGAMVDHGKFGQRRSPGFPTFYLRKIHPPATKSFGEIIQALRKGTPVYG